MKLAKCKECNGRIDFDLRDLTVKIGENLLEIVDGQPVKLPVYGKFPYIRRGRWYWHPQCYPDKLNVTHLVDSELKDEFALEVVKNNELVIEKDSLEETIKVVNTELQKTLEENSKLIETKDDAIALAKNYKEKAELFKADYVRVGQEKVSITEESHRCFDELSIYKQSEKRLAAEVEALKETDEKLELENAQLTAEVADYHKLQADLKEQLENGKAEDAQKE